MLRRLKNFEYDYFSVCFKNEIGYCEVPSWYFETGKTYGWFKNGKIIGGFALINGYSHLRAIRHLPYPVNKEFEGTKYGNSLCEITGFFITKDLKGINKFLYGIQMLLICIFHERNYFIYSYRFSEIHLARYYSAGDPYRIYSGALRPLEGYNSVDPEPEHVEVLSKYGITKIIISRMLKTFLRFIVK